MIIVQLIGGLGNQMFQYAIGRNLANKLNTELKLDISAFESYTLRQYNLFPFNIIENFASLDDLDRIQKPFSVRLKSPFILLKKALRGEIPIIPINERFLDFDEEILNLPNNVYLKGYWQSEKYFKGIENIIRNEYTFKAEPDSINKNISKQIKKCNSIGLHIRRGDYVTNSITKEVHGDCCPIEYYLSAIEKIDEMIPNPVYYVFSDDPKWAQENLNFKKQMIFITHNGSEKNFEDLRLMSNCKHHIIANSSFSWWGAWLSSNQNKVVIAPIKWFSDEKMNGEQKIVPLNWIKI